MKLEGTISAFTANKNIECAKTLLTMLKKQRKDPQLLLGDIFNQINHKNQ